MAVAFFYGESLGKKVPIVIFPDKTARIIDPAEVIHLPLRFTYESLLTDEEREIAHRCWQRSF